MANDDKGHSINDDLRMMGLLGDDEEDLGADREDLFGRSAASPINLAVDDDGDGGAAGSTVEDADTLTIGHKRKHSCTSDVWNDFDKVYKVVDGKNIRFQAVCKHCKAIYSSLSSNGIGHVQ